MENISAEEIIAYLECDLQAALAKIKELELELGGNYAD